MSIQANFPTARPSLLLDFANTKSLDPRITFTRASTANYYDGKTATMAEQNGIYPSANLASTPQTNAVTITSNIAGVTAPDGTETVSKFVPSSASTLHYARAAGGFGSVTLNVPYTFSFYAKAAGLSFVTAQLSGGYGSGGGRYAITVDLTNGVINGFTANQNISGTSAAVSYVGNGWYRISITGSPTAQNSIPLATGYIVGATAYNSSSASNAGECTPVTYGDGTNGVYVWGFQVEQRSTVSAYTATTSVPITNYIPTLQSAASGVPRFDSNPTTGESLGLLIEESRTNLLLASAQFETSAWGRLNSSVASDVAIAPDGTKSADKFIVGTTNGYNVVYQVFTTTAQSYTLSAYAKAAEYSFLQIFYDAAGSVMLSSFDLVNGVVGTTASGATTSITPVGDGWYRCAVTFTGAAAAGKGMYFGAASTSTATTFTGDGKSGIYIWGAQFEAGSSATSYVATPLTFTSRASSATYLGPNGYITSAATNVARNQTNSVGTTNLLLEAAASNILTYTEQFYNNSLWPVSGATVAQNSSFSPDGAYNGTKLYGTATTNYISRTISTSVSTTYTFSIYANIPVGSTATMYIESSGGTYYYYSANLVGEGVWQRYSLTFTTNSNNTVGVLVIKCLAGIPYYIWGAQMETGSTATSYIPSVETWSSRASTATYYNSSGVLATAASGASRTTYNPALLGAGGKLLLEPAATNVLTNSGPISGTGWAASSATVTTNSTTSPDGTSNASKLAETAVTTADHYVFFTGIGGVSGAYTYSVYLKAAERSYVQLAGVDAGSPFRPIYDLSSGTVVDAAGTSAFIQYVGNGWYRCGWTKTASSLTQVTIILQASATYQSYLGVAGSGVYMFGAQVEAGSGPTSYIATTTTSVTRAADASTSAAQSRSADVYSASTVTRAADAASMTGTNFSSWYSSGAGTLYAEYATLANLGASSVACPVEMNDGTQTKYFQPGPYTLTTQTANTFTKNASSLAGGQSNAYVARNGSYLGAYTWSGDTYLSESGLTQLQLGQARISYPVSAVIKKVAYYPTAVTQANIQALTS